MSSISMLNLTETGLSHVDGARQVIAYLKPSVKHLVLGHNDIGDCGSIAIFEYLCSAAGRRIELVHLDFGGNRLGDIGLRAVSTHIRGNTTLEVLNLQNNQFTGTGDVVANFTLALNESRISSLSLMGNSLLSDDFSRTFFSSLTTPYLRELDLSLVGLTPDSSPFIVQYLSSFRSRHLRVLKCNGNRLGSSLRNIIRVIRDQNFWLEQADFFANSGAPPINGDHRASEEDGDDPELYPGTAMWVTLRRCRERNRFLRTQTETEALRLLTVSRSVLSSGSYRTRGSSTIDSRFRTVMWHDIPVELKLEVLSYVTPNLSPAQLIRVSSYAADITTLPPLSQLPNPGQLRPLINTLRCSWLFRVECDYFDPTTRT